MGTGGAEPRASPPQMLGRYALYGKIASGGMASVHIGRLLGPVGFARTVAIKRMHPQLAEDPSFVSMFLDEARLAARIRHPNVVPTLDVVAMTGELFLVMEFVQGESLARLIRAASARGERIPAGMVATILAGALHGLHAAHEATNDAGEPLGIVHRDVSPHNVLVGVDGVARVLDFGVAKAAGRVQTTREGQLKGKLPYMSPEQVHGQVSRTTDVYAAAVVLWEALTGKGLFRGDSEAHVLTQVLKGCTTPPSAHVPDLPKVLDEVTMRGLSVDPGARFPTARDMARALEDALPLVGASKIGDWVHEVARATLDERSALIASIESDSSSSVRAQPVAGADAPVRQPPPPVVPEAPASGGSASLVSRSNTSVSADVVLSSPARRVGWITALGAVLLLAIGIVVVRFATSSPSPAAATSAASSTEPASGAGGTTTGASSEPPPGAGPVTSSEPAPSAPPAPSAARAVPRALTRPTAAQPAPARAGCKVVTNYDADGQPHFSKVCP